MCQRWRRGQDSNLRSPLGDTGFQNQRIKPLCHPSVVDESGSSDRVFDSKRGCELGVLGVVWVIVTISRACKGSQVFRSQYLLPLGDVGADDY